MDFYSWNLFFMDFKFEFWWSSLFCSRRLEDFLLACFTACLLADTSTLFSCISSSLCGFYTACRYLCVISFCEKAVWKDGRENGNEDTNRKLTHTNEYSVGKGPLVRQEIVVLVQFNQNWGNARISRFLHVFTKILQILADATPTFFLEQHTHKRIKRIPIIPLPTLLRVIIIFHINIIKYLSESNQIALSICNHAFSNVFAANSKLFLCKFVTINSFLNSKQLVELQRHFPIIMSKSFSSAIRVCRVDTSISISQWFFH